MAIGGTGGADTACLPLDHDGMRTPHAGAHAATESGTALQRQSALASALVVTLAVAAPEFTKVTSTSVNKNT
jgi:hypothetical protein